jgi:hypothetical protein
VAVAIDFAAQLEGLYFVRVITAVRGAYRIQVAEIVTRKWMKSEDYAPMGLIACAEILEDWPNNGE